MSIDRCHSLPKKNQPNLSSLRTTNTAARPSLLFTEPAQCPEISDFNAHKPTKSRQKIYIHNLHIDYGRLEQPEFMQKDQKIESRCRLEELQGSEEIIEMETKRMTGIASLLEGSPNNKNTEKKVISKQYYLQLEPTQDTPLRQITKNHPQPSKKESRGRSTLRLQEVRAYEDVRNRQSGRKILHSRIVRMVVGGGLPKTRVICYPDKSDYMRLASNRQ